MKTLILLILLGLNSLPAVAQIVPQPTQLPPGVLSPGEQAEAAKQQAQMDLLKQTRANQVAPSEGIMGEPVKPEAEPAKTETPKEAAPAPQHPPCATAEACMVQVMVEKWFAAEVAAAKMEALQRVTPK